MPKCPTCDKEPGHWDKNKFYPFCCERCQVIDLGRWCDGKFAIECDPETTDAYLMDHPEAFTGEEDCEPTDH